LLATVGTALSFALFALGGADPTDKFFLRTLSFASPSAIIGLIWDMLVVSRAVIAGVMYEG
jgi:tryptophan-rich sensory protein